MRAWRARPWYLYWPPPSLHIPLPISHNPLRSRGPASSRTWQLPALHLDEVPPRSRVASVPPISSNSGRGPLLLPPPPLLDLHRRHEAWEYIRARARWQGCRFASDVWWALARECSQWLGGEGRRAWGRHRRRAGSLIGVGNKASSCQPGTGPAGTSSAGIVAGPLPCAHLCGSNRCLEGLGKCGLWALRSVAHESPAFISLVLISSLLRQCRSPAFRSPGYY